MIGMGLINYWYNEWVKYYIGIIERQLCWIGSVRFLKLFWTCCGSFFGSWAAMIFRRGNSCNMRNWSLGCWLICWNDLWMSCWSWGDAWGWSEDGAALSFGVLGQIAISPAALFFGPWTRQSRTPPGSWLTCCWWSWSCCLDTSSSTVFRNSPFGPCHSLL